MTIEPIQLIAVLAAAALLVAPYVPAVIKRLRAAVASLPTVPASKDGIGTDDLYSPVVGRAVMDERH